MKRKQQNQIEREKQADAASSRAAACEIRGTGMNTASPTAHAFKISGVGVIFEDPVRAAVDYIDEHYKGWSDFDVAGVHFPSVALPPPAYAFPKLKKSDSEELKKLKNENDELIVEIQKWAPR